MSQGRAASVVGKILVFILLISLGAVSAQYGLLVLGGRTLQKAAHAGAREAASAEGSRASVLAAVQSTLEGKAWASRVHTDVLVAGVLDVGQTQGTELARARSGSRVQVEVSARAAEVVPYLFGSTALSIQGLKLSAVSAGTRQ